MRKFAFLAIFFAFLAVSNFAAAQQGDAYIGFGTVTSPSSSGCGTSSSSGLFTCPEKGGLYFNLGADMVFRRRVGIAFDVASRFSQGNYGDLGLPYRPLLYDLNGVYQPRINKKVGLDLVGGIGWQSTRFYTGTYTCNFVGCINYTSSNHFLVDVGAGLRYYVWGHVFVRPEVRYYKVFNNENDFTSGNVVRVGASIGYTISPD